MTGLAQPNPWPHPLVPEIERRVREFRGQWSALLPEKGPSRDMCEWPQDARDAFFQLLVLLEQAVPRLKRAESFDKVERLPGLLRRYNPQEQGFCTYVNATVKRAERSRRGPARIGPEEQDVADESDVVDDPGAADAWWEKNEAIRVAAGRALAYLGADLEPQRKCWTQAEAEGYVQKVRAVKPFVRRVIMLNQAGAAEGLGGSAITPVSRPATLDEGRLLLRRRLWIMMDPRPTINVPANEC